MPKRRDLPILFEAKEEFYLYENCNVESEQVLAKTGDVILVLDRHLFPGSTVEDIILFHQGRILVDYEGILRDEFVKLL